MYVRRKDLQILENMKKAPWKFRTKLELAAELVEWCVFLFPNWFQKRVMVIADGAYAKRPFLIRVMKTGAVVVSRLRKDAALFDLPEPLKNPGKGRPPKVWRESHFAGSPQQPSPGLDDCAHGSVRSCFVPPNFTIWSLITPALRSASVSGLSSMTS